MFLRLLVETVRRISGVEQKRAFPFWLRNVRILIRVFFIVLSPPPSIFLNKKSITFINTVLAVSLKFLGLCMLTPDII